MADGASLADVDLFSPAESGWTFKFFDAVPATTRTVGRFEEFKRLLSYDASTEDALDRFRTKKEKREDEADIPVLLTQEVVDILDEIESTLLEDREEGLLHGEACASEPALATCRGLAVKIAPWLARSSGLKWAAFGEDEGGVSLVLRSLTTNRRADFRILGDGRHISAICIDEYLSAESIPLALDDRTSLRERAAWVHGRP
ncbi:MAG: hypothetical protein JSU86_18915 [Phycisphaerales bacterium]|nr:MAG: hypothetical protein JSU86_18915 [Phycisphaerales bacterium]